ncbi:hypothetical protein [Brevundimonas sp. PAMC22021]|uniref:hypothetical protein n=1 Tax=Brevundimonas sp. PAMC22021 TaxID=2861285 RepID=UPI001C638B67|nr:hypothetical protein [Brevundimonas sp. PAMC22021]QYF87101.1 hypothetical protein KY493_00830 [Brevundimonas sp. PAMC22021]
MAQVMGWISVGSVCLLVGGTPLYIAVPEIRARPPEPKPGRSAAIPSDAANSAA